MALVADSRCLHCSQIRRNRDANNNRAVNVTSPGDEMVEEALLVALEGRPRGGFRLGVQSAGLRRNTRGLKGRLQVGVNDLIGIGMVLSR